MWWPTLSGWQSGWKKEKEFESYLGGGESERICRSSFPFLRQTFPSSLCQLENIRHLQHSLAKLPFPEHNGLATSSGQHSSSPGCYQPHVSQLIMGSTLIHSSLGFQEATLLFHHLSHWFAPTQFPWQLSQLSIFLMLQHPCIQSSFLFFIYSHSLVISSSSLALNTIHMSLTLKRIFLGRSNLSLKPRT